MVGTSATRAPIPCAYTLPYIGPGQSVLFVDDTIATRAMPAAAQVQVRAISPRGAAPCELGARAALADAFGFWSAAGNTSRLVSRGRRGTCSSKQWYAVAEPLSPRARRPRSSPRRERPRSFDIFLIGDAEGGELRVWTAAAVARNGVPARHSWRFATSRASTDAARPSGTCRSTCDGRDPRADRPLGLGKDDASACAQSPARTDAGRPQRGLRPPGRRARDAGAAPSVARSCDGGSGTSSSCQTRSRCRSTTTSPCRFASIAWSPVTRRAPARAPAARAGGTARRGQLNGSTSPRWRSRAVSNNACASRGCSRPGPRRSSSTSHAPRSTQRRRRWSSISSSDSGRISRR